ncbi:MAG: hypothetical protein M1837_002584 [Sclerophora amabilis]|nr:MAG: hypothetical protein M1837_002584 [Sclerophora amabilis]
MPSVPLYLPSPGRGQSFSGSSNPLPELLQTPSGLALLELQGTINMPVPEPVALSSEASRGADHETSIGRVVFPDYSPSDSSNNSDMSWMKRVYLYVGKHQRLTGEVKKLPNPMAIIRRRDRPISENEPMEVDEGGRGMSTRDEELEIVEVITWKILFSQRPEPVGS